MLTMAIIESDVSLTPLSCGLIIISISGSTKVINSILFFSSYPSYPDIGPAE
jgi:hypothetical protein